ncbi:hypothetical protein EG68_00681 [Paragonimus skrjabini miyazakii]|uniref:ApaG domain-containing protein n=1 Tax=Paragonimus skrjabini miyazakii TaxID=59628 RepID=A0A8S9Z5D9_9TREM|nr:hypothetical protein EG68_00681 [Paragonimus skrjabini miyazakii]
MSQLGGSGQLYKSVCLFSLFLITNGEQTESTQDSLNHEHVTESRMAVTKRSLITLGVVAAVLGFFHLLFCAISLGKAIRDCSAIKRRNALRREAKATKVQIESEKKQPKLTLDNVVKLAVNNNTISTQNYPDYDNYDPEFFTRIYKSSRPLPASAYAVPADEAWALRTGTGEVNTYTRAHLHGEDPGYRYNQRQPIGYEYCGGN